MAREIDVTDPQPTEDAKTEFVPAEQFRAMETLVNGLKGQIEAGQQTIQGLHAMLLEERRRGTAPAPRPVEPDVTDDEIDEAIIGGKAAAKVRKMVDSAVARVRREEIEPLRTAGLAAMSNFAAVVARDAKDEKGQPKMPHYPRFKDEIDGLIAKLNPVQRTDPDSWIAAHNIVVGQHATELIEEAKAETAKGSERGRSDPPAPNGRSGRTVAGTTIPKFEEHFSADVVKSLGAQAPDDFCRSLGYADWADYYQKTIAGA